MKKLLLLPIHSFGVAATALIIGASLVYWGLGSGLYEDGGFGWDQPLMLALHSLSQPWLDTLFLIITQTGGSILIVFPVLAMLIYL